MKYEGKEICQGCGQPGTNSPRSNKNSLCWKCEELLKAGKAYAKSVEPHRRVYQHHHAFRHDDTNKLLHQLLAALDNPNAKTTHIEDDERSIKEAFGNNGKYYTIPRRCFEPIKEVFEKIDSHSTLIEQSIKALPEKVKEAVQNERDRIFNEGVEKGRNLLMQLESGNLSMEDFYKNLPYHNH